MLIIKCVLLDAENVVILFLRPVAPDFIEPQSIVAIIARCFAAPSSLNGKNKQITYLASTYFGPRILVNNRGGND